MTGSLTLRKVELGTAFLLTLAVLWLYVVAASSAGGLWRDEANTVGLATLPTVGDVWANLQYDSFPMLWVLIVRGLSMMAGPMNDPAFRAFTFLVGVAVLATVWVNARVFLHSLPLLSLALFAMNPSFIRWGVSMRAYGLGIACGLLSGSLLWRFVERPTALRFALAGAMAIASVHVLFYNSLVLLAFSAGAFAVCAVNRAWKEGGLVFLIGGISAISLLPYAGTIRSASSWNTLVRVPDYTIQFFWYKLAETTNAAGFWSLGIWLGFVAMAVLGGAWAAFIPRQRELSKRQHEISMFALVSLVVAVPANFFFLRSLSYITQPWYYLSLLALVAVCADALLGTATRGQLLRIARILVVLIVAAATLSPATRAARTRLTNLDIVTSRLKVLADSGDIILVAPWHYGVSFNRYYQGPAVWMTVPTLGSYRTHRYDILKKQMNAVDQTTPVRSVIEQSSKALRTGRRLFIVGGFTLPRGGQHPSVLPPLRLPGDSRSESAYEEQWSSMVGYFLKQHAMRVDIIPIEVNQPVNHFENPSLRVATGWRP